MVSVHYTLVASCCPSKLAGYSSVVVYTLYYIVVFTMLDDIEHIHYHTAGPPIIDTTSPWYKFSRVVSQLNAYSCWAGRWVRAASQLGWLSAASHVVTILSDMLHSNYIQESEQVVQPYLRAKYFLSAWVIEDIQIQDKRIDGSHHPNHGEQYHSMMTKSSSHRDSNSWCRRCTSMIRLWRDPILTMLFLSVALFGKHHAPTSESSHPINWTASTKSKSVWL